VEINCLGCGFKVDLTDDYNNYEGHITCFACGATMEIITQGGNILGSGLVTEGPLRSAED
jgi:hypothetical protein